MSKDKQQKKPKRLKFEDALFRVIEFRIHGQESQQSAGLSGKIQTFDDTFYVVHIPKLNNKELPLFMKEYCWARMPFGDEKAEQEIWKQMGLEEKKKT